MKTRQWRVFRGGLRFARSAVPIVFEWARHACCCDQLDDAGNASLGGVSPTVEESVSSHQPRGSQAFRCVSGLRRASRRSRWSQQHACLALSNVSVGATCAWTRHCVTCPAEGIFRRRVADGRGVRVFAPTTRIARLPMRFRLRGASRRSRWLAPAGVLPPRMPSYVEPMSPRRATLSPWRDADSHSSGRDRRADATIASDATHGAARKRIGRRVNPRGRCEDGTPRPSATPRREMRFPRRRAGRVSTRVSPARECVWWRYVRISSASRPTG